MSDRCNALWRRFKGMYGGETLSRKYGDTPPPEWETKVAQLKEYELERGMRRLLASGKPHIPTLPEFLRMCREVGGEHEQPSANPLRIEGPELPRWSVTANRHLLAHLLKQWHARNAHYRGADEVQPLIEAKNAWAQDMREAEASGKLPADHGLKWWDDYMHAAEGAIATVRSKAA